MKKNTPLNPLLLEGKSKREIRWKNGKCLNLRKLRKKGLSGIHIVS
jgi:hypothetical protein